ncbi:aminopeptidase [Bdellovibrio sp. SKB1291214]|uniref:C1 family peptidase n=1 Tax=Bdellovibrio sp. SKB1291214 TaxID=1732569 RepID=UPI0020CE2C80|nr:C1 family peptidase [Bdellovibrio sp. SKB1291214]UYL08109.1 aminopeptidase [Bdellovibrio sp. SKB1291214]
MNWKLGANHLTAALGLFLCLTYGQLSAVNAQPPVCAHVFSGTPWGSLRSDFKHNTHYTKEIPQEVEVKNQCNLGTCHLHSWLASIEKTYTRRTGDVMPLSNHYLSAKQLLTRSLMQMNDNSPDSVNRADIDLGAGPFNSRDSILEFGVIPESVWTPKTEFYKNPTAQKMKEYFENIIARTKSYVAKAQSPEEKQKALAHGEEQLRSLFNDFVGELPSKFNWKGQQWTPQEFAKEYFSFFEGPQKQMIVLANRKGMPYAEQVKSDTKVYTDLNTVEATAALLIDRGQMVYLAYEHHAEYVDKPSGILSIRAFYTPSYAKPLTRTLREQFDKNDGGHAVQIVGYERDPQTGKILKWKIKNSWGTASGDDGYYHMYDDYFRAFAKSIAYSEYNPGVSLKMSVKGH